MSEWEMALAGTEAGSPAEATAAPLSCRSYFADAMVICVGDKQVARSVQRDRARLVESSKPGGATVPAETACPSTGNSAKGPVRRNTVNAVAADYIELSGSLRAHGDSNVQQQTGHILCFGVRGTCP